MRTVFQTQMMIGTVPIEEIELDLKSRDDVIAYLYGLQQIFKDPRIRKKLFTALDSGYNPVVRKDRGRPGMDLWRVLVLAGLRQAIHCDYDRLALLANGLKVLRQMMGHSDEDDTQYNRQTIQDNVSALSPELLEQINQLVVNKGHEAMGRTEGDLLKTRGDSKVVKTNVEFPTDVRLLWDTIRCLLRECVRVSEQLRLRGWRQHAYLQRKTYELFQSIRTARQHKSNHKGVEAYLEYCRKIQEKAEQLLHELDAFLSASIDANHVDQLSVLDANQLSQLRKSKARIVELVAYVVKFTDQIDRRILRGETIPPQEKVLSIFKPHTRWIKKGKAGVVCELGVPVAMIEDEHQFILGHEIIWTGTDKDVAVSLIKSVQAIYPDARSCSLDRGFYSPASFDELDQLLEVNATLKKGRCTKEEQQRQATDSFKQGRKGHSAVESALNNLDQRGWDVVREVSPESFARVVGTAVLAANLHRLGRLVRNQEQERAKRRRRRAA